MQNSSNADFGGKKEFDRSLSMEKIDDVDKSNHERISLDSQDITEFQLKEMKKILPHVFTEGKIDFNKLKIVLGDNISDKEENYSFNWVGRQKSYENIRNTAKGTLKPDKKTSLNFDVSENIFIQGDNLEVLKLLQKAYFSKIKMIYIDPPYNTGKDFMYKDNFTDSLKSYLEQSNQINENGIKLTSNPETSGRFHSDWISMMYTRLFIARNLLMDTGTIFVSIDDYEVHNLRMIMNEIFGEENFIGQFVWRKKVGAGADSKLFFRQHEYMLFYAKDKSSIKELYQPLTEKQEKEYSNPDNDERGPWAPTDLSAPARDNDPKRIYEVKSPTGKTFTKCWSYTKENFQKLIEDNVVWWGADGNSMPKRKRFLKDKKGLTPRSWIDFFLTSDGRKDLKEINMDKYFDYPKPLGLMKHIIKIASNEEDIILDFFAGSGTTAQAVLELNQEEESNRKFILVQLPESIDERSEAYKAGFKNISDIAKERIKTAIHKLNNENASLGFKSFNLSKSNFKVWENYEGKDYNELINQMRFFKSPLIDEFKNIDVIYECIIKEGYNLNSKIKKIDIDSNIVYKVCDEDIFFYICLDYEIKSKTIDKIQLNKDTIFICLDGALDDSKKVNLSLQCNLITI